MKVKAVIALFFMTVPSLNGVDRSIFFGNPADHYSERPQRDVVVDWTAGYISTKATVYLKRIVYNERDPDFAKPWTAMNLSEARSSSRQSAMERASEMLMKTLTDLRLESGKTVDQKRGRDEELNQRIGNVQSLFIVKSENTGEGYVSVEMALPFYGRDGLMSLLVDTSYGEGDIPEIASDSYIDNISGIIIDLTEFPDFRPSLLPRILSDQGRFLYGKESVPVRTAIKKGIVAYHTSPDSAKRDSRAGIDPYYIYASSVHGGDIHLDSSEVTVLLSSPSARRAFRSGQVIIVLPKR